MYVVNISQYREFGYKNKRLPTGVICASKQRLFFGTANWFWYIQRNVVAQFCI